MHLLRIARVDGLAADAPLVTLACVCPDKQQSIKVSSWGRKVWYSRSSMISPQRVRSALAFPGLVVGMSALACTIVGWEASVYSGYYIS